MPKGYETANGTFDPTVNTLFINKEMLQSQPEYEQMFYLFTEATFDNFLMKCDKALSD